MGLSSCFTIKPLPEYGVYDETIAWKMGTVGNQDFVLMGLTAVLKKKVHNCTVALGLKGSSSCTAGLCK